MYQLFFLHKYYMLTVFLLFAASFFCQIILGILYGKLIYETERMATTENKSLKQIKRMYTSCMELNDGVPNVSAFVDKHLQKVKWNFLSLSKLKHLSGQLTLLGVVVAGVGACGAIADAKPFEELLPFYLISFLGIYAYLAVSSLVDVENKKKQLRANLVDYLENHQGKKLERMELDKEYLRIKEEETEKEAEEYKEKKAAVSEQEELKSLLRELLT